VGLRWCSPETSDRLQGADDGVAEQGDLERILVQRPGSRDRELGGRDEGRLAGRAADQRRFAGMKAPGQWRDAKIDGPPAEIAD